MKFRGRNFVDLLFFNWLQSRFVVVELKVGRFEPEYAGRLVRYSLAGTTAPLAVANYTYDTLPDDE